MEVFLLSIIVTFVWEFLCKGDKNFKNSVSGKIYMRPRSRYNELTKVSITNLRYISGLIVGLGGNKKGKNNNLNHTTDFFRETVIYQWTIFVQLLSPYFASFC